MADRLMIERFRFHRGTGESPLRRRCQDPGQAGGVGPSAQSGGRGSNHRDPGRPRSFDRLARCTAGCFKSRERLAHDPGAALGQGDQILTQPVDVLLHREATNFAVTIPQPGARLLAPKELSLNHQRRVAGPAADPNEILVRDDGAVGARLHRAWDLTMPHRRSGKHRQSKGDLR